MKPQTSKTRHYCIYDIFSPSIRAGGADERFTHRRFAGEWHLVVTATHDTLGYDVSHILRCHRFVYTPRKSGRVYPSMFKAVNVISGGLPNF